jgi:thymidylate synthase (FAD)
MSDVETKDLEFRSDISVQLIDHMGDDASICRAAKVSTQGADSIDSQVVEGLINFLMKNRHGTPFEHNAMTFMVHAPIMVFREWHRHRTGWSYNEESGRYKQLDPVFYVPTWDRPLVQVGRPGEYTYIEGTREEVAVVQEMMMNQNTLSYSHYEAMLANGVAREVARSVLPVNIYSSMYATCNARSLMHFLSLRTRSDDSMFPSYPMHEIALAARACEALFAELFPVTYACWVRNGRVAP